MNQQQKSKQKLKEINFTSFYTFSEEATIKFENFASETNKQTDSIKKNYKNIDKDVFIGIKISQNLELSIYKKTEGIYVIKKRLSSKNLGLKLIQKILLQIQAQKEQVNLIEQTFKTFEVQAINKADLFVSDIYGPDSSIIGISGFIMASSLGMLAQKGVSNYHKHEITRSILIAFAINVAQLSGLYGIKHNISKIVLLENPLKSIIFTRFIYTLLKYYNSKAQIFFKQQKQQF